MHGTDLGWRMIFWILTAMGAIVLLLILIFLPETSKKHIEYLQFKKTKQLAEHSGSELSEKTLSRATLPPPEKFSTGLVRPLTFLKKPVVLLASLPYALAFGFMYFIIATLPQQLEFKYGFNTGQVGLAYLANGIGNAMGAVFGGQYSDWYVNHQIKKSEVQQKIPEMRLGAMWIGILLLPIGDLIYGWCLQARTSVWLVLGGFFLSMYSDVSSYSLDDFFNFELLCSWTGCWHCTDP